jgi:hypothetical protein
MAAEAVETRPLHPEVDLERRFRIDDHDVKPAHPAPGAPLCLVTA